MTREEYYTDFSSAILEFSTTYFTDVVMKIIELDDYLDEPKRFFYTLVHKTITNLEASNLFIRNFEIKSTYNSSLFVLLRASISDIILAEYVLKTGNSDKVSTDLISRIYFDHIENSINSINSIKKNARKAYNWTEKETQEKIDEIKESKKQYFDENGIPKLKSLRTSPYSLTNQVFSEASDPLSSKHDLFRRAFDLYSLFSKFEHFGDFTFHLVHRPFYEKLKEPIAYDLYDGVRILCFALKNYIKLWDNIPEGTIQKITKLTTKITSFDPSKIKHT